MTSRVAYMQVRNDCPCCEYSPVAFDSEEGKARRRRLVRHYGWQANVQIPLSVLATISGVISFGLAIRNASWPYLNCFPFINGIMMLVAGWFARRVGQANLDHDIPSSVKSKVMVHYVLSVICCTASGLAAGFGINGLVYCLAERAQLRAKCTPEHDLKTAFVAVDVALGALLLPLCVTGMALFCLHARSLGFADQLTRMQNEVAALRVQVETLQRAHGLGAGPEIGGRAEGGVGAPHLSLPPPPYSEFQDGVAYGLSGAEEYGYGKSKSSAY